jgi:hypothetical protein
MSGYGTRSSNGLNIAPKNMPKHINFSEQTSYVKDATVPEAHTAIKYETTLLPHKKLQKPSPPDFYGKTGGMRRKTYKKRKTQKKRKTYHKRR